MTSKQPPWTREEFDVKLAAQQADPNKAATFQADLTAKVRKGFEDLSKREASLVPDSRFHVVAITLGATLMIAARCVWLGGGADQPSRWAPRSAAGLRFIAA